MFGRVFNEVAPLAKTPARLGPRESMTRAILVLFAIALLLGTPLAAAADAGGAGAACGDPLDCACRYLLGPAAGGVCAAVAAVRALLP